MKTSCFFAALFLLPASVLLAQAPVGGQKSAPAAQVSPTVTVTPPVKATVPAVPPASDGAKDRKKASPPSPAETSTCLYICNPTSKLFFERNDPRVMRLKDANKVCYASIHDAETAGCKAAASMKRHGK